MLYALGNSELQLALLFLTLLQDLNKRLSLPADIRIPDGYLEKLQINSPPFDQPMSRRSRRASLVSVIHLPDLLGLKIPFNADVSVPEV